MATNRKKTIKEMEAEWDSRHENEGKNARNTGKTIKEMEAEWDRGSAQRNAIFAANDYNTLSTNLPGHIKSFTDSRYQLGGGAAIKNSGVISEFATYDKYIPIISRNFAAGKDYLGLTDDEVAEYQAYMQQMAKDAVWGRKAASARTGGLDAIDMTGMPRAQQRELQNMGNLSQTDYVYAALSQPAAETQKPNIGKMFDDQNLYEQFVASGASMPGAEQKNLFGETVTNDDQLSVLLGERKTYDDYLKMYSAYPSQALRKDLMNIQSYNTERNVYAVTPEQYEASRARVYAATGTDYDSIARKSGGTDNKWMLDALGKYEEGEKYLAENVFGDVSEDDWYRYHDAYMRKMESSSRAGNQLDAWEEEGKRQTQAQLNAPDGIDHYRPAPMYLNIDPTYLEGYREYQNEDGTYMPAEEYRENAINEWLMAYVDAGNDEAKIKALDEARGEYLPELEEYNLDKLRYLEPDQQKAIFTAFNNGDVETAKNLIQTYDPILNYQRSGDVIKAWEQKYNEANTAEKIGMNVQSVGQNVGTALEGVKQAIWSVAAPEELEKITAYDPVYDKTRKANKTRELTGGEIAQATNGVNIPFTDRNLAEAIYHGVMSGADSFAIGKLFAPFGPAAQAIAMGGISYANERMGKLEAGYSNKDANMDAWVQAFIEGVTEYIPFDIMSQNSPNAWRKALGGIYAGSVGEAVSELGGGMYDEIKYGDYRDQLLVEGNRGSEASLWMKWLKYKLPDAAAAAVGGIIGEAPMQIVSASSENRKNKTFGENIRDNDSFEYLTDLAESVEISDTAKGIVERMRGEIADKKKGEKGKGDKTGEAIKEGGVTKAEADAAVKEIEQTARDKGKRGKEGKRSKSVSNAEIGYVYREVMKSLDSASQNVVAEAFSRDVLETELAKAGFRGDMRKAANTVEKFINGKGNKNTYEALRSNQAMRKVALDFVGEIEFKEAAYRGMAGELAYRASKDYVKPESTKAEKGAQEATRGIDDRAAISAEDIEVSDVPESTVDGKAVTIEGVASVAEDGSVTFSVKDADGNVSEVSETDVAYGQNDAGIAAVAQNAKELGADADRMLKAYNSEQNAAEYSAAFKQAVQYGDDGRNLDVIKNDSALSTLTEQQIEIAYNIGRGVRTGRNDAMVRKNASGVKVGQVDISGVDFKRLTKHQRTSVHTMSRLAKIVGFNIRFVESKANAEGKYTTENGSWDPETLTLTLDVHAGSNKKSDVNYAMMHTAGHELTHYIRQFADADMWNAYQEFVIGHLSTKEDGVFNLEDRINKQIEGARKKGRNLTRDGAIEEIIADASGEALNSISEADIQALAETNPSLLNKVKQFFQRWIKSVKAAIKAAYSDTEAKTAEAKMMMDAVDEMGKRWNELFVNAAKNRASENVASETTTTNTEMQDLEHAHIDQRTFDSVADADTTLFCSEVEEAQIGMAAAANILLADLENSIPGQKVWLADNEVTGQKRQTSELLGRMKDELGLTWDGLLQRLQQFAGMEDADQLPKNNLNNRRIELYLNEMLTEGYTTLDGTKVNAWDGYIDAMQGYEGADAQKKYSPIAGAVDFTDYAWPGDVMYDDRKKYSERVTDEDTLDFLNNQKTVTTYKTMQLVDGKLYPLMAAVVAGKYEDASELGTWEATVEHPELIKWGDDGKAYFKLDKGQKRGSLDARYNPYMHSSNLVLNDQFTGAYARDNLVTVQCEVPVSELDSGYHAEHAKDPVGWHPWHAGPVAGTLRNVTGTERQVLLSRWIKPVRIVPDSEVAAMYKELLDGTGITVPENVVPPGLKAELEKAGVPIASKDEAKKLNDALKKGKKSNIKYSPRNYDVEVSDVEIEDNIRSVIDMDSVVSLKGDEVTFGDGKLKATIVNYFNSIGGKAYNDVLGDVELTNRSYKDDLGHGMYPLKALTFYAVPTVIEKGKIIDYQPNWQGKGIRTYIIAAPITIKNGENKGEYWLGVIAQADRNSQRLYAHDVVAIKKESLDALQTGTTFENSRFPGGTKLSIESILQKLNAVKYADAAKRNQDRDFSELSDRELLVQALETELTPAERDHLERYKTKVDKLGEDQGKLEKLTSRIVELKNAGYTAKTSEELRVAETNATTLRRRIDREDAKLKEIESAAMIKEVIKRNREAARKEAYTLARQRADERQRKAVEHAREVGERRVQRLKESQGKEKYKKRILEDVKKLHTWVASPTNKGSVPEFLREPLAEFIDSIDFSSDRLLKGGDPTQRDIKFTKALDRVREAVSDLNKQYAGLDSGAEAFAGFVDLTGDFAEEFDKLVRNIKDTLSRGRDLTDTPFNRMSAQQLKELSQMFKVLRTSIRQMNMNLANSRYESNRTMSRDGIDELGEMKARTKTNKALELLNSTFNWKNTTPYYAFERLGRAGKAVFEALQDGWDKMAGNSTRVINYAKETFNEQESKAWSGEIDTIELDSGETVQMTTAQKMSLYCHTKREQSRGHLMGGGIRMSDIDGKHGSKITQTEDYVLTENDIANIIDSLTDRQREVADKLQRFMNTVCAEWGNEISMKRFGFEQMTEKNYFPIKTDSNNRASIDEDKDGRTSMFRLLNMSSLKPLTPGANNAIIIEDIFNVFSDHASDMAKYNALALPILDFIKWYNYVERNDIVDESGNPTGKYTTRSTQKSLERVFGKDAKEYLRAFIKDLNAEHDGGRNDGLINNIVGKAKSAAVGANLRVYALQVTSLPRAAYVINPKYLVAGAAKLKNLNPVNAIKGTEAQEKVGILQWKKLGFYSTDINRSTREMIKRNEGWLGKVRDWQMAPAGWGDNLVSNIIYEAAKAEMKDKHSDIREGTAEYDYMLNKRVREIVYKTQVVDSTMTRSDLMRSKGLASMITAFMSEPTLTVNMLSESIHKAVELGRKGGNTGEILRATGGLAVKAASVHVAAAFVTAMVESIFDAFRDDDEYETFLEKMHQAMWGEKWHEGNFVQNLNPITMLPILNEAWSILVEGYEDSSLMTQVLSQGKSFMDAIKSYKKGNTTPYNVIYKGAQTISSMGGVGVSNAMRDFTGLYNTFLAPAWGTPKLQTYEDSASTAANAYYGALKENRTEDAAYYKRRMEVDGIDQAKVADKVATLIGDDYVAGNITEANARKWFDSETALDDKKIDTKMRDLSFKAETGVNYDDFRKAYLAGTISKTEATRLLKKYRGYDDNEVYFMLDEWAGGEDWTKLGAFLDAVDNQGNYAAEAKKLLDHGVEKDDIARAIAKAYKEAYREIYGTQAGNLMLEYLLDVYEVIGYDRADQRKYIARNWFKD